MAAGVPADKLYPIDIDKAFASYDKIKDDVVKWWDTGAVPVQLLTDQEVVMTSVWNGRMAALQAAGVPAAISWTQGLLKRDCWAVPRVPRTAPTRMKFVAYSTMAIPQARLSSLIPYGFVNDEVGRVHAGRAMKRAAERAGDQVAAGAATTTIGGWRTATPSSTASTNGCWDERRRSSLRA